MKSAWLFIENGCTLEGLIRINGEWNPIEDEKVPAYLFRVK